uniref:CST complex subunit TEN1 n=1 Tax=Angiostrongylus cantonensis TaxID=6313 RepID=A0A0K0DDK8_ANGCA
MSHTVSSTCNVPFYDRPQTPLSLLPYIENAQAHTLVKDGEVWDGYVFALLLRMRGSITENKRLLRNEEGDEVYVDGSELRGMQNIKVHVHFEKWTTFISFTVWYPQLPITLWLGDAVLNSISGWPITVWKNLQGDRHYKGTAKQFACGNRFQQTELRVFASFQVSDERTGERVYLSGQRDMMFDVTSLAADSIISIDRSILTVQYYKNRILVQAVQPGKTRDGEVCRTLLHYEHGSFLYQLFYSDDTVEFLDDVSITDYILSSQSADERVLALAHKAQNGVDMIALDDLSDPLVELELRPPVHCTDIDALPLATLKVALRIQYEKLVAPLLSRLSSSSSGCERDEDSKEWVWLGKTRNDTNSIGSRCSQPSTINVIEESSPSYDENTQASISYRGSEISVFISPTPVVTVSLVWKTRYYRMIRP